MSITDNGFSATRRLVLKGTGTVAMIGLGAGLGVIAFDPKQALAAANDKYPEEAFKQKSDTEAIKLLYGKTAEPSDKVKMDAPEIAENGAVVPVSVSTTLTDVTSIAFLVSENQQCDRHRGSRRQALQRHQGSQSHRRRLRRLRSNRTQSDGIDHSRARHFKRRHHRSAGPDPASDGFGLRQGRARCADPAAFHPGTDLRI